MTAATARRTSSVSTTELARQGDLNKYYQPWIDSKKLPDVPPDAAPAEQRQTPCSHDTTLTAFAQLAALRLNVKRSMVSLIDTNVQIILAEATQTLSLVDERRHAPGDQIWLGNVSLPRQGCMDEHVLGSTITWEDQQGRPVEINAMVVRDTLEDERFCSRPYVTGGIGVRFYAGVPIITKQGHAIGVYAVSDVRPRPQGLNLEEVRFMEDVAQIIAEHLERVMATVGRGSDRDFMRGISYFLEDLSEFKHNLSSANRCQASHATKKPDVQATDPQAPIPLSQGTGRASSAISSPSPITASAEDCIPDAGDTNKVPQFSNDGTSRGEESSYPARSNVDKIFSLASQLLCDQAGATGCLFLDAASGLFSDKGEESSTAPLSADFGTALSSAIEFSDDGESEISDVENAPSSSFRTSGGSSWESSACRLDEMADLLSISLAGGDSTAFSKGVMKRRALKNCIIRYPYGECFYMNKGRDLSNGNSDGYPSREEVVTGGGTRRESSKPSTPQPGDRVHMPLPKDLLDRIPDAQWVVFLPLFDYARGHWCAAGIIWGNDFKMGDPEGAFPYFKTFGSCMMSEIASMEVLNTDIAKSTFIASISHDLRSPLHGMLGSLEFLEDTMTSAYQMSLFGAIETCGKTLLDTIDHLLEYAKINNLSQAGARAGPPENKDSSKRTLNMSLPTEHTASWSIFDLAMLYEEVVEAVFTGQTFRKTQLRHPDPIDNASTYIKTMSLDDSATAEEHIHSGSAKFSGKVFFILRIERSAQLYLQGQTGALRRVIMNVVGNAIKYCNKGCIETSLDAKELSTSEVEVKLTVKDTGVGMSHEFLANRLFKAFAQEDPFTPGTGLGLSITHQIVKSMSGEIHVDSEKGVGTHITITIPFKLAPEGCYPISQENLLLEAVKVTSGQKVCFLNPVYSKTSPQAKRKRTTLESSISTFCCEWFSMDVIESESVDTDPDTGIFIYAEPPPIEDLIRHHNERKESGKSGKKAALLIICTNAFEAAALRAAGVQVFDNLGRVVEVVSQPVGVRKLAKVLLQCLQRVKASSAEALKPHNDSTTQTPSFMSSSIQARATKLSWNATPVVYEPTENRHRPSVESLKWRSDTQALEVMNSGQHLPGPLGSSPSEDGRTSSHMPQIVSTLSQRHSELPTSHGSGPTSRVLLVDDNAINLKLLVTFTKKLGLPYAEAINGLEAVTQYKEADHHFDFVLMDLQMPIMDGLEATRQIREYELEKALEKHSTIIAITGVGNEEVYRQAMDAGMSQFLTKPVKFRTLQDILIAEGDGEGKGERSLP
ncbi:hypothetical protein F4780DRAFT_773222 [Xylariomycetidae sp. FL0641]|nr:hypothetical protein F4780DRAFT_773222 [Xylariomycetidae sp. FL0641]